MFNYLRPGIFQGADGFYIVYVFLLGVLDNTLLLKLQKIIKSRI